MLEVGYMEVNVVRMAGVEGKKKIFASLTVNLAKTMGSHQNWQKYMRARHRALGDSF
ncbi:hypothetical protein LAV84_25720 [Rhizobium sp. VS19-DR104.2]|uniref:hypothetical protein n=1 Tax=unclassified Rhizobium TaxID=2613769 RepID=UPI001CC43894|nr:MULTISPECIES: hypothetical protein [unclassified Rhizobium]MBZ5762945.1 hypothetical protein [Rhizobium sp. VS19-DR96]MBZ5768778.1 hypothetical protein [Rhizobium sp. VS19-DR129.2]MBZ5776394.1 hypothetical protein [Rhizobium sp. VS19-DRK62.2]MBZ5787601.1 hypothetical protein [Rhizobium sp. VS19-DR121]MBZ5804956.1 hypothetical protein [Rhizobium sp. VS19-DR181]